MFRRFILSLALALVIVQAQASTLLSTHVGAGANNTSCSAATTFIARTSGLDAPHILAYTELICGLVATGEFSKFDALWIMATKDATTAQLNLTSTSFTLSFVSSLPTFTADRGFTGNGTTNGFATGFNLGTNGVQCAQNSCSLGIWDLTAASAGVVPFGADNGTNRARIGAQTTLASAGTLNGATDVGPFTTTSSDGFTLLDRTSSVQIDMYRNDADIGSSSANTSNARSTDQIDILCQGPACVFNTADQLSIACISAGLSAADELKVYNLFKQYLHGIGAI